jgi:hypothetical protein
MAASEHISGKQFFHGTNAELEEGALITPKHSKSMLPEHLREVHATDNPKHARFFGKNVYEVSPINHEDLWGPQKMDRYDNEPKMNEFTSRSGFKVIRQVN